MEIKPKDHLEITSELVNLVKKNCSSGSVINSNEKITFNQAHFLEFLKFVEGGKK